MNKISDLSRTNFTIIPNIIDDMQLSPRAFRLYFHIKRRAGDDGACWESSDTMAKMCNMSKGSVINAKKELSEAGLIDIVEKKNDRFVYHEITITDIWEENTAYQKSTSQSNNDRHRSNNDRLRSYIDRINIPINKNPINNNHPSDLPEVPEGFDPLNDPLPEEEEPSTPFAKLRVWWERNTNRMVTKPFERDCIDRMVDAGVTPEDLTEAVKILLNNPKYKINSITSLENTAIGLASKRELADKVHTPTIDQFHPTRVIL